MPSLGLVLFVVRLRGSLAELLLPSPLITLKDNFTPEFPAAVNTVPSAFNVTVVYITPLIVSQSVRLTCPGESRSRRFKVQVNKPRNLTRFW